MVDYEEDLDPANLDTVIIDYSNGLGFQTERPDNPWDDDNSPDTPLV